MSNEVRVVDRDVSGKSWAVRAARGSETLASFDTKTAAINEATEQLEKVPGGGKLIVYFSDGRLESSRLVTDDNRPSSPAREVLKQIDEEGGKIDKGLETIVNSSALIGTSALSAYVSPEVLEAAREGWMAVFFATLTWCLGCALAVVVLKKSGLVAWPLAAGVSMCFLIAMGVANFLGRGVLEISGVTAYTGTLLDAPLAFVEVAFMTYGPVGALLGAGIGAWLGHRFSKLVPDGFAL